MCYGEIKRWVLKKYIFDTLALVILYKVKVSGGTCLSSNGNSLKNVQRHVFTKFLQFKKQTPYTLPFLEMGSFPIKMMAMKRFVECMLKVERSPHVAFLEMGSKQKDPKDI